MQIQPAGQDGQARLWRVFAGTYETREHWYRSWPTPSGKIAVHGQRTTYVTDVDGRLVCSCLRGSRCVHRDIAWAHREMDAVTALASRKRLPTEVRP